MHDKHVDPWERIARFEEQIDHLEGRIERLEKAMAVFAEPESWSMQSYQRFMWNKMGDYFDPREFARLALEGK